MPLLGGLFVNLFSGLVAWLTTWFTRKVAFATAAIAMYSFLTGGLFLVFRGIITQLEGTLTGAPQIFMEAMAMGVPPAAPFCLATYVTMWTACTVYTWQRDLLSLAVKA